MLDGSWSEVFYCMCWTEAGVKCSTVCVGRKLECSVLLYVLDGRWSEVFYCMCWTEAAVKCSTVCVGRKLQ